jgi:hypothetical protein
MLTDLLDLRSSFVVAAMFVSWVVVALLALVVGNLYRRLQRLESSLSVSAGAPYAHLLGRRLWECLGETVPLPCVLVFLSANCAACRRVLGELPSLSFSAPLAIAWTDHPPSPPPALPPGTIVLDNGPKASAALGIRVTPFALVAGEDGRVVKASPVNSLSSISTLVNATAGALRAVPVMTG